MYFRSYGLAKRRLDNYLKGTILQDPSTSNMVKGLQHISNYNDSTFIILTADRKGYSVLKSHY